MSAPTIRPARSCSSARPSPSCRSSLGSPGAATSSIRCGPRMSAGICCAASSRAAACSRASSRSPTCRSDAVAIGYASPLMVVVLAALILHEKVRAYRWSAVAIGFVGVLIMLMPHLSGGALAAGLAGGPAVGAMFALLGAVCSAGATIQVRRLLATERTGAIVLYFSLMTTVLGLATIVLGWRVPTAGEFALLVVIGILGGIGQILLTQSYR